MTALLLLLAACGSAKPATAPPPPPDVLHAPVQVVQTSAGAVGYRSVGNGPPIVLIMGFGGSIDAWAPPFVDDLARHHRVLLPDNAGIGRTANLPQPLTATAMAGQVAGFIRALKLSRPEVLGWSMGGFIAQALAVQQPALLSKLVLCATFSGDGQATLPSAAVTQQLQASITDPTQVLGLLFPPDQQTAALAYGAQIEQYPDFYLPSPTVATEQLAVLVSWSAGAQLAGHGIGSLKLPTLVLDGDEDVLTPVANAHHLAATIPGAQIATYPDAGHAFLFQDEQQVVARIERL
jgi:pimeloyl-ACP methyl ester carboxylesterase